MLRRTMFDIDRKSLADLQRLAHHVCKCQRSLATWARCRPGERGRHSQRNPRFLDHQTDTAKLAHVDSIRPRQGQQAEVQSAWRFNANHEWPSLLRRKRLWRKSNASFSRGPPVLPTIT